MNHNLSRLDQDSRLNIRSKKGLDSESNMNKDNYPQQNKYFDHREDTSSSYGRIGEITGKNMKIDNMDHGMPIRSIFHGKQNNKFSDTNNNDESKRLDFHLYDEDESILDDKEYKINYHDPYDGFSGFNNNATDKVIPELYGMDPGSFISININKFTLQLHNLLQLHNKFCISSYSLYAMFSALYTISKGKTETDIYDYFSMIAKDNVYEGITYINQLLNGLSIKNIIFINNEHKVNIELVKHLSKITNIQMISTEYIDNEFNTINNYVKKISNGSLLSVSKKVLEDADMICMTLAYINPSWIIPFDRNIDMKFKQLGDDNLVRLVTMMNQTKHKYKYFEDELNKIIEIPCIYDNRNNDNKLAFGIILPNEHVEPVIKINQLTTYIKQMKYELIENLLIPEFTQQMKIRLSNVLYQNGLKSVFTNINVPEFTKDSIKISDIVQNITIIVNNKNNQNIKMPKRSILKTPVNGFSKSFIADHPFIYYLRLVPTNTILIMGYFC